MNRVGLALVLIVALVLAGAAGAIGAPFAYIPSASCNNVTVIDTATNTVTATVTGVSGPYGVAVSQDGSRVYITNPGSNTVSVIDATTNTVVATVTVGSVPLGVAVSPDGARVYVANLSGGTVSVINTASNAIVATIPVPAAPGEGGVLPVGVAVTPDGKRLYVTDSFSNIGHVAVIDTATQTGVTAVSVNHRLTTPAGVAVTPDGKKVYVADSQDYYVSVIDTATNAETDIFVGLQTQALALSPDGAHVYVTTIGTPIGLVEIDTSTNMVTASLSSSFALPQGIAVTPDGSRVYVANAFDGTVSVINAATNTVGAVVPVGGCSVTAANPSPYAFGQFIQPVSSFASITAKLDNVSLSTGSYQLTASFTLAAGGSINPVAQTVAIKVGTSSITIPAGSFQLNNKGYWMFFGTIGTMGLEIQIAPSKTANSHTLKAQVTGTTLAGMANPVPVTLTIGSNTGTTSVTATIGQ